MFAVPTLPDNDGQRTRNTGDKVLPRSFTSDLIFARDIYVIVKKLLCISPLILRTRCQIHPSHLICALLF